MAKRVLIVDDEVNIAETLREFVEEDGYDVTTVNNGKKAIEAYERALKKDQPFHMILLDIVMPRMSGLEVLDMIRQDEKSRQVSPEEKVPIIMLSGLKESWMNDAYQDGCNDYLVKPYDMDVLMGKIKKMIGEPA